MLIGKVSGKSSYDGQVLGCDFSSARNVMEDVDSILMISSGRFHSLGVAYFTKKKTIQANPYTGEVKEITAVDMEKEKYLRIEKARNVESFAIVYSEKPGQMNFALAESLKQLSKKPAYLITMNEIMPDRLDYLPFEAFVITACPRIVLDDWKNYKKPVLLLDEFEQLNT